MMMMMGPLRRLEEQGIDIAGISPQDVPKVTTTTMMMMMTAMMMMMMMMMMMTTTF
jgi:hypothetical protein